MMTLAVYLILAFLTIAFAAVLTRPNRPRQGEPTSWQQESHTDLLNESGLDLAVRIFDPADYHWLGDEVGFPELAQVLARQRKKMALMWLRGLRTSFNDLVRVPRSTEMPGGAESSTEGWAMTFLTLRFQLLLAYATIVVWVFGPYTRIVPSFGWLRPVLLRGTHQERFKSADVN